jgi:phospholipid-binding lipoprotein MlaA
MRALRSVRSSPGLLLAIIGLAVLCFPRGALANAGATEHDPWERFNRAVFWFNDRLDVYAIEPAAQVWNAVLPNRVQRSLVNFFDNLRSPVLAVNDLLQGKGNAAAIDYTRFMVNTTIGLAGFFDPATPLGLPKQNEDFGQTLGRWGVGPGPYLVLPFLGPSSPRDLLGWGVDGAIAIYPWFVELPYTMGSRAVDIVNYRSMVLDQVREAKAASIDYYAAVRAAYIQRRALLVNDGAELSTKQQQDLYQVEE